jgi:SAM-dependent methyltransferase
LIRGGLRQRAKWLLFPGLNLHARLRGRRLAAELGRAAPDDGDRVVLDAGCGNGMLAYESFRRGNQVLGISIKDREIRNNRALFHDCLGVPPARLRFERRNIYELAGSDERFDEIICTEVLEHIERDADVCRVFWQVLKAGGVLHLCCPNADHPDNREHPLDSRESGGHVRPGYTLQSYRELLEPVGFRIEKHVGVGGPVRQRCNKLLLRLQERGRLGSGAALVLFVACLPLVWVDQDEPAVPYSLYVRAVKAH